MLGPDYYVEMAQEATLEINSIELQIEKLQKLLEAAHSKRTGALLELEAHRLLPFPEQTGISF